AFLILPSYFLIGHHPRHENRYHHCPGVSRTHLCRLRLERVSAFPSQPAAATGFAWRLHPCFSRQWLHLRRRRNAVAQRIVAADWPLCATWADDSRGDHL